VVLGRYPGIIDANVYGVQLPNNDGKAGCAALMLRPEVAQSFDLAGLLKYTFAHAAKRPRLMLG
jgi:hypothetical protein